MSSCCGRRLGMLGGAGQAGWRAPRPARPAGSSVLSTSLHGPARPWPRSPHPSGGRAHPPPSLPPPTPRRRPSTPTSRRAPRALTGRASTSAPRWAPPSRCPSADCSRSRAVPSDKAAGGRRVSLARRRGAAAACPTRCSGRVPRALGRCAPRCKQHVTQWAAVRGASVWRWRRERCRPPAAGVAVRSRRHAHCEPVKLAGLAGHCVFM